MESLLVSPEKRKTRQRQGSPTRPAFQQPKRGEPSSRAASRVGFGGEAGSWRTLRSRQPSEDWRAAALREAGEAPFSKVLLLRRFHHSVLPGFPSIPLARFQPRESIHNHFRSSSLRYFLVRSLQGVEYATVLNAGTTCSVT